MIKIADENTTKMQSNKKKYDIVYKLKEKEIRIHKFTHGNVGILCGNYCNSPKRLKITFSNFSHEFKKKNY